MNLKAIVMIFTVPLLLITFLSGVKFGKTFALKEGQRLGYVRFIPLTSRQLRRGTFMIPSPRHEWKTHKEVCDGRY